MTNVVDSTVTKDVSKATDGSSEHSVKNPYIKESDWGWLLIQKDKICLIYSMKDMKNHYLL